MAIRRRKNHRGFWGLNQLQTRLVASYVIPIVCIVVLGFVSYNKASESIVANYEQSMGQTIDMTGQYYRFSLEKVENDLLTFYHSDDLRDYYKGNFAISVTQELQVFNQNLESLKTMVWNDPLIDRIYILNDDSSFLMNDLTDAHLYSQLMSTQSGQLVNEDESVYHWFGPDEGVGGLIASDYNQTALRVMRKFKDQEVVLVADINREEINQILSRLDIGQGGYLSLVSPDGYEIGHDTHEGGDQVFYNQSYYTEAMAGEDQEGSAYVTYNGTSYLYVYSKVADSGLSVCALIPKESITRQVSGIQSLTVMMVLIACGLSLLVCTLIVMGITKKIGRIQRALNQVANGDLSLQLVPKGKDVFSQLEGDLSSMITNVRHLIQQVKLVSSDTVESVDSLADASKAFVASTKAIHTALEEMAHGLLHLDENAEDCTAQIHILSEKINLVQGNTEQIGLMADGVRMAIATGTETVTVLSEKGNDTSVITNRVIERISRLENKAKAIGDILGVINDISEQSNLLALNATIEASRASGKGQGFGVISSEMRHLSEHTLKSAKEIQSIINEIVQDIDGIVSVAKEAGEIVGTQSVALEQTAQSFWEVSKQMNGLIHESDAITHNASNMEAARTTTEGAVQSISAVSEETTAISENVAETVANQRKTVDQVDNTIQILKLRTNELEAVMNQFHL